MPITVKLDNLRHDRQMTLTELATGGDDTGRPFDSEDRQGARDPLLDAGGDLRGAFVQAWRPSAAFEPELAEPERQAEPIRSFNFDSRRAAGTTERITEGIATAYGEDSGVLYLLTMITGIFAQGLMVGGLLVDGDAAATATDILGPGAAWIGFQRFPDRDDLQTAFAAPLYELLKPSGRSLSLVAAFLGLAGCIIKTFSRLFYVAPLFILGGAPYLRVFSHEQLQALALLFLKLNDRGAGIALAFFGFYAVLTGYLMIRSTFLPRILGVLSVVAGVGWLSFLLPPLGYRLFQYVAPLGLLGAATLIVWLLVFGVNEQRWKEQARAGDSTLVSAL